MEEIRGNEISMIFQEPMTSLNPLYTVGQPDRRGDRPAPGRIPGARPCDKAVDMLRRVSIPEPEQRAHNYPHQMSGGMRQRVMIAMALSCNPKVLIADEPTTALDVTIQAQILELLRELQQAYGMAIVLITHDMGVVAENADRVIVMYAGRKVEEADVDDLFERPAHPYTRGLLGSIPHLDEAAKAGAPRVRLNEIKGMVPSLVQPAAGVQLRAAMRPRHRSVPRDVAAAGAALARPLGGLLARGPRLQPGCAVRHAMRTAAQRIGGARRPAPLLEVRDLKKQFPIVKGLFSRVSGAGARRRRRLVPHRAGRDARAGRRERLRQVDGGAHAAEAARAEQRLASASAGWTSPRSMPRRCCPTASACR